MYYICHYFLQPLKTLVVMINRMVMQMETVWHNLNCKFVRKVLHRFARKICRKIKIVFQGLWTQIKHKLSTD